MQDVVTLALGYGAFGAMSVYVFRPFARRAHEFASRAGDRIALADWLADAEADRAARGADPPVVHDVPQDVAEFVIPGFRPGVDVCRIALNAPDVDFDVIVTDAGVRLLFLDGGWLLEVIFPGLGTPPIADTVIIGPDGVALDLTGLAAASAKTARGKSLLRQVQSDVVEFRGFDAASEMVEVWVPGDARVFPDVSIRATSDGHDGELLIDGSVAARLCGAPEAGARNVRIVGRMSDAARPEPTACAPLRTASTG